MRIKTFTLLLVILISVSITANAQSGAFSWGVQYGGTGQDRNQILEIGSDGYIYTTGRFEGTCDFDQGPNNMAYTSNGARDIYISKLDKNGNIIWAKTFGGDEDDQSYDMKLDENNNLYVAGRFRSTVDFDPGSGTFNLATSGYDDAFVAKYNSDGDFVWAKKIGSGALEMILDMTMDHDGNMLLMGRFNRDLDFDPNVGQTILSSVGAYDLFIVSLDTAGNFNWAKTMEGKEDCIANSITVDEQSNVYVGGIFSGEMDVDLGNGVSKIKSTSGYSFFIAKYNPNMDLTWAKVMNQNGGVYGEGLKEITIDENGNIYHVGVFTKETNFDPSNNQTSVQLTGNKAGYISKLDSNGNFKWVKTVTSQGEAKMAKLVLDEDNQPIITGWFDYTIDIDPGSVTRNIQSNGETDAFVLYLDTAGEYLGSYHMGSTGFDHINKIQFNDDYSKLYVSGSFSETFDMDPGNGTDNVNSNGDEDAFIIQFDGNDLLGTHNVKDYENLGIYIPNAFTPINNDGLNEKFAPIITERIDNFGMDIYNRWGEKVFTTQNLELGWDGTANGTQLNQGSYFYVIQYSSGKEQRILKGTVNLLR